MAAGSIPLAPLASYPFTPPGDQQLTRQIRRRLIYCLLVACVTLGYVTYIVPSTSSGPRYTAHWYTVLALHTALGMMLALPLTTTYIGFRRARARLKRTINQQCASEVGRWSNLAPVPIWLILQPHWKGNYLIATLATPSHEIVIPKVVISYSQPFSTLRVEQSGPGSAASLWFSAVWCEPATVNGTDNQSYNICFAGAAFAKVPNPATFMIGSKPAIRPDSD
jgi:hypothetical protein